MKKGSQEKKKNISQKILRYPLNGRSSFLLDKFYIFGYDSETLKKILYNDNNLKNIINDKKQIRLLLSETDLQKFQFDEPPSLINEFTSDYEKECLDIDMIRDMIFPKNVNIYYAEEEKIFSKSPEKRNKKRESSSVERIPTEKTENHFGIFDENYDKNNLNILFYNVVFSSNPQTGNNSKKSINGFAYIFYRKLKEDKKYLNKSYSFFIPIIFCVISEFPFYNSFYQLCQHISLLFQSYEIRIPLEIILHNIVNLTPSPLNADVYLSLKSFKNFDIEAKINMQRLISDIQEEEDFYEENETVESNENNNNENNNNKNNNIINLKLMDQINYKPNNDDKNTNKKVGGEGKGKKNSCGEIKYGAGMKLSGKFDMKKRTRRTIIVKKSENGLNTREITTKGVIRHVKTNSMNLLNNNIKYDPNAPDLSKRIKFDFLSGYPVIQYNLAKVLLSVLSPIDVIDIFLYTFLEKDVLFFSRDLELLSLTINSYLNLNFPLNDEKYYFINACVSYDNYIKGNSTFVGSTFTTIIGINDQYNPKYQTDSMNKLKEHIAVDLDNGKVYKVEDKNNPEKSKKNKELFNFIKNISKSRENKNDTNILSREISILNQVLSDIYNKMREKIINVEEHIYYSIYKINSYISYDKHIKEINLKIQDSFYRFINNISLYFYQNLTINDRYDNKSKKGNNRNNNNNNKEEEMNVIFLDEYKEDESYSKEELYLLEELTETMKFQSFVYGFVQSYNPIDLYKIPLTFTEEFISIISRKSCILDKEINFLSLIDKLYCVNKQEEISIDFEQILIDYYINYKNYFDREIDDNSEKNILHPNKIKLKLFNSFKKIIKYKGYELDERILNKYLNIINELNEKDETNSYISQLKKVKENIPKIISVTDIESVIENYAIETGILSASDLCCANIIILFTLSLRSLNSLIECQSFLGSLFQSFTVFRKYYSIIMSMIYTNLEESLKKNDFSRAKDYYFLYYLCINSLRNFKLIPNENLMNIIKKFNKINPDSLKEDKNIPRNKEKKRTEENKNIKLYGVNLPEDEITNKNLYVTHNFSPIRTFSEEEIVHKINDSNYNADSFLTIDGYESMQPKIKFNNGIHPHQSFFYSQRLLLSALVEDYHKYIIEMEEGNLRSKIILDACLNIFIYMRNSKQLKNNSEIKDTVKKIFYIFLNQLQMFEKEKE